VSVPQQFRLLSSEQLGGFVDSLLTPFAMFSAGGFNFWNLVWLAAILGSWGGGWFVLLQLALAVFRPRPGAPATIVAMLSLLLACGLAAGVGYVLHPITVKRW